MQKKPALAAILLSAFLLPAAAAAQAPDKQPEKTAEAAIRDPFVPEAERPDAQASRQDSGASSFDTKSSIRISGVIYDNNNPLVLIGDKIFKVGDRYKEAVIKQITDQYVVMEIDGKDETFYIVPPESKQ